MDAFFHGVQCRSLQDADADFPDEPNARISGRAVNNLDLLLCAGVVKRSVGVLVDKTTKGLAPWMMGIFEKTFRERPQLFDTDYPDESLGWFTRGIRNDFGIEGF